MKYIRENDERDRDEHDDAGASAGTGDGETNTMAFVASRAVIKTEVYLCSSISTN